MASFATRSIGAWRAVHFDDVSKLGSYWASEDSVSTTFPYGYQWSGDTTPTGVYGPDLQPNIKPTIDMAEGASTAGALRFDIPTRSSANASGAVTYKFADDDSIQIGPTGERVGAVQEVYVQVRVKWNTALATTSFLNNDGSGDGTHQGGIKFFDIHTSLPRGIGLATSSSDTKQVVQTFWQQGPTVRPLYAYYYGLSHQTHNWQGTAATSFDSQNQRAAPYCRYPNYLNCWDFTANEWITITLRYKNLGRTVTPDASYCNFEGDLWVQNDGQARIKLSTWGAGVDGYEPSAFNAPSLQQTIGAVVLFPYMTGKDPAQYHDPGIAWYDELIVGPNDPGEADASSSGSGGVVPAYRGSLKRHGRRQF